MDQIINLLRRVVKSTEATEQAVLEITSKDPALLRQIWLIQGTTSSTQKTAREALQTARQCWERTFHLGNSGQPIQALTATTHTQTDPFWLSPFNQEKATQVRIRTMTKVTQTIPITKAPEYTIQGKEAKRQISQVRKWVTKPILLTWEKAVATQQRIIDNLKEIAHINHHYHHHYAG